MDVEQDIDFVGKAALRRIRAAGITQKLLGIEIYGEPLPGNEHPWPVHRNGEASGKVTSAIYSPRLKKNIALAMLPIASTDLGTQLTVETPLGLAAAVVAPQPFVLPRT